MSSLSESTYSSQGRKFCIGRSRERSAVEFTPAQLTSETMDQINMTNAMMGSEGDALTAKITSMVVLFSVSMVVGCLPMIISLKLDWFTKSNDPNLRSSNRLVKGLLAFGGGVLFATTFMHLLPEVDENVHILQEEGQISELPLDLAPFIMCIGFFMMYLIEELVHMYIKSRNGSNFARAMSIRRSSEEGTSDKIMQVKTVETGHVQAISGTEDNSMMTALRGLLIVLALSVHELFEGLAVGLESSAGNVWYMFGAVSAHKYIIAFCVGVELLVADTKKWLSIVYIFTYSFMSALGIGVGILLVGGAGAADAGLTSVILQGIACGTLLYVVFFEVWRESCIGMYHLLCSVMGFSIMVCLEVIVEIVI